jgi:hypothetical protein
MHGTFLAKAAIDIVCKSNPCNSTRQLQANSERKRRGANLGFAASKKSKAPLRKAQAQGRR